MDSAVLVPTDIQICSASKTALTRPQRTAKAALEKLIERDGDNVLIGDWRREAIAAGLTQSESRQGKHAAFTRAVDALVDAGIIHVDGNNCRLCAPSKRQQTPFVDAVDAEKPVIFANKTPSTRQQTSTFRQHVDAVDGRSSLSPRQHLSTHPFRGVDNVDVDASRQPDMAELEKQETQPANPPPAKDAAALEAEGRRLLEEAKTAPPGVQALPTGEYVVDPTPGSRVDLQNQGNRLLEQARKMRLAEAGKRESPPADSPPGPDILADIPTASPPETQGKPSTCADKRPDMPSDKPAPPIIENRIVATLRPVPGGMSPDDLIRAIKNDRGCTPPMIQAAIDRLLVSRVIGKINGRLVASGGAA